MTAVFTAPDSCRVTRADEGFDELLRAAEREGALRLETSDGKVFQLKRDLASTVAGAAPPPLVPDFAARRREMGMIHPIPPEVADRFNCWLTGEDEG